MTAAAAAAIAPPGSRPTTASLVVMILSFALGPLLLLGAVGVGVLTAVEYYLTSSWDAAIESDCSAQSLQEGHDFEGTVSGFPPVTHCVDRSEDALDIHDVHHPEFAVALGLVIVLAVMGTALLVVGVVLAVRRRRASRRSASMAWNPPRADAAGAAWRG